MKRRLRLTGMVARRREATDDASERDMLARIAAGDRAAFEDFYRAYARRVLAFVRDVVNDAELAEEVTGDVMIAVWKGAGRYAGRARVTSWVLGIAHHKAVDALRRRGLAHSALDDAFALTDAAPTPEEAALRGVDRETLELALRALTPEHRAVLVLTFAFERSQAEIADIVACPLATVKTRLFYAKRRLRAALTSGGGAEERA